MSIKQVIVDGVAYDVAPMEPEHWDKPSPAYPLAVTPEVARAWLRYNYRNRVQRRTGKRDYAADIRSERFDINGTSVTFSRPLAEGEDPDVPAGSVMLIDGQHRLEACSHADKPFVVYVAYGIKPEARRTVDTGIKRQLGDVFSMEGEANALAMASIVKRAYFWSNGDKHLVMREDSFTHSQGLEFFGKHPELRRSTEIAVRAKGAFELTTGQSLRQSVAGLAHWLFMQADPTQAPEFFARLGDGAGIEFSHPVSALRRRLIKDRAQKVQEIGQREPNVPDWKMLCYYIRSWNIYLNGPDREGKYPEYALVGRRDKDKMPEIVTAADVEVAEAARIAKLRAEAS